MTNPIQTVALADITQLIELVHEQGRKIERLEKALSITPTATASTAPSQPVPPKPETPTREKLTEGEFAERVGVSATTVSRARKKGIIQYRQSGRSIFYLAPEDVDAWFQVMTRKRKDPAARLKAA